MNPISNIQPLPPPVVPGTGAPATTEQPFIDLMVEGLQQVNAMQQDADRAVQTFFTGGDVNPAEVLTAVQKADLSFRMMLQIRNKLVQAYQEIKELRI